MNPIARKALSKRQAPSPATALLSLIQSSLDDDQAESVAVIDMAGKSAMVDFMVVATGRASRHVAAMAEHLRERVKAHTGRTPPIEGLRQGDWVLVDAGDVVIHLFRAEVRAIYNLEKMWSQPLLDAEDVMARLVKEKTAVKAGAKAAAGAKPKRKPRKPAAAKGTKPAARKPSVSRGKRPAKPAARRRRTAG